MIEQLEIDDQRPLIIIDKVNEIINWINNYEEAIDNMDRSLTNES